MISDGLKSVVTKFGWVLHWFALLEKFHKQFESWFSRDSSLLVFDVFGSKEGIRLMEDSSED